MADLRVTLGNLVLQNPILTASGTFGYGEEYQDFVNLNRVGGLITKSITLKPRAGNFPYRVVETVGGMLNSIGLANVGVESFIEEKLPFLQQLRCAVIVNIAGSSIEEYEVVLSRLEETEGIDAYEINLSCPNVKEGGLTFGKDPRQIVKITTALRKRTTKPLIVKLTPNVSDMGELAKAAEDGGADIISAINTIVGMAVNVVQRRPVLGNVTGGLSGPAIKPIALARIWEISQKVKIPIIGIGGIFTCNDVLEFLVVGASAVQIGTANFIDPAISEKLVDELAAYCEQNQIARIRNLIGTLKVD
ncbi:dihydroorotate dehydrogenase [candidate division KSB1 bacterium]|nr:MAG: dihydroorotate dehydrogenase [candidate division KSB1 bacterium]